MKSKTNNSNNQHKLFRQYEKLTGLHSHLVDQISNLKDEQTIKLKLAECSKIARRRLSLSKQIGLRL